MRWRQLGITLTLGAFPAWLLAGGVAWSYVIGWYVSRMFSTDAAATVRYAGTLLQIFGVASVAVGLHETRKLFPGRPSIGGRVRGWFKQVAAAFRSPRPITVEGRVGSAATVSGRARVRLGVGPNASVDDRFNALERNLAALQDELDAEIRDVSAQIGRVEQSVRQEVDERKRADASATHMIEEATIGGLNLEAVGLLWLMLGVLGQGCPDEIVKALQFVRLTRP